MISSTAMCPADNLTSCVETKNFPDQSSCVDYYQCLPGFPPVRQRCTPGTVFNIYVEDCVPPDNSFDCGYRCQTPAPTTAQLTTNDEITSTSLFMTTIEMTSMTSLFQTTTDMTRVSILVWRLELQFLFCIMLTSTT